jgi:hypothetical protein
MQGVDRADRRVEHRTDLLVAGLSIAGAVLRMAWAANGRYDPRASEASFIAAALADGRGFADAFGPGTGPTAHLMPLTPLPAALAYRLLGVGTPAAELTLGLWAAGWVALSIVLAAKVMQAIGATATARVAAAAIVALVPLQFPTEGSFRYWESAIAACAILFVLLRTLRLDRAQADRVTQRDLLTLGAINGATFVCSPAAGLATSGVIGLLLLRRVDWRRWWVPTTITLAVIATVLGPWALRNSAAIGAPVPMREGMGISLALAYYDGRIDGSDPRQADYRRFREVSPLMGVAARREYVQKGEVAYNKGLTDTARRWISHHQADVWRLRLRNFIGFYAPPAWLWVRFTDRPTGWWVRARAALVALSAIVGWVTIFYALWRRRWSWLFIAAALLLPSLPYIATYPLLRYRYLVSTLLIFVAVHGTVSALTFVIARTAARRRQIRAADR